MSNADRKQTNFRSHKIYEAAEAIHEEDHLKAIDH